MHAIKEKDCIIPPIRAYKHFSSAQSAEYNSAYMSVQQNIDMIDRHS